MAAVCTQMGRCSAFIFLLANICVSEPAAIWASEPKLRRRVGDEFQQLFNNRDVTSITQFLN